MSGKGNDTIENQKAIKIFYKSMYDLFNHSNNDNKLIDKIIFNDIKLTIFCEVRKDEVSRIPETEEKTSENSHLHYLEPTAASNSFEKSRFIVKEIDYNDQQNLKGHIEFLSENLQQSFFDIFKKKHQKDFAAWVYQHIANREEKKKASRKKIIQKIIRESKSFEDLYLQVREYFIEVNEGLIYDFEYFSNRMLSYILSSLSREQVKLLEERKLQITLDDSEDYDLLLKENISNLEINNFLTDIYKNIKNNKSSEEDCNKSEIGGDDDETSATTKDCSSKQQNRESENVENYKEKVAILNVVAEVYKLNNKIKCDYYHREGYGTIKSGWTIFYTLKELISIFDGRRTKTENIVLNNSSSDLIVSRFKYNYFRGYSNNKHDAIPAVFRNRTYHGEKKSDQFYSKFEGLYQKIAREYPEELEYDSKIESSKRNDAFSRLQHYGFGTCLLDMSRNPYTALLFMIDGEDFHTPKFELFEIEEEKHRDNNIVYLPEKFQKNKRLIAQNGAFLHYEKLFKFLYNLLEKKEDVDQTIEYVKENLKELEKDVERINRITVVIEVSKNSDSEFFKNNIKNIIEAADNLKYDKEVDANENTYIGNLEKRFEPLKNTVNLVDKTLQGTDQYTLLKNYLKAKLDEYGHSKRSLFPDFQNYVSYENGRYKRPEEKSPFDK
ncbi:MAG: FRG domain-containing protein [Streptococcus intermedius]|uniref:FRG domain-containing protein n=1 Tax=Streptococcus intermedius TaxID=1338 RepID=A0A930RD67_STRIT|nr:FRG domain-containing protein [Streptococcus intermedius]